MPIGYLVREIHPPEVSRLKIENSQECPGATPNPKGGGGRSCRGLQKHMYGSVVSHPDSAIVNPPPGVSVSRPSHNLSGNGRAATSRDINVTNWDLGASEKRQEAKGRDELGKVE